MICVLLSSDRCARWYLGDRTERRDRGDPNGGPREHVAVAHVGGPGPDDTDASHEDGRREQRGGLDDLSVRRDDRGNPGVRRADQVALVSIARNVAAARCCAGAALRPNQASFVMFTSTSAPARTKSRTSDGKIAS